MTAATVREAATIAAPAGHIYEVLADYRRYHFKIMPPAYFAAPELVQGGYSAGTVYRVTLRHGGGARSLRLFVTEPMLGTILMETDEAAALYFTHVLKPLPGWRETRVFMEATWLTGPTENGRSGAGDLPDPDTMGQILRETLANLSQVVAASELA